MVLFLFGELTIFHSMAMIVKYHLLKVLRDLFCFRYSNEISYCPSDYFPRRISVYPAVLFFSIVAYVSFNVYSSPWFHERHLIPDFSSLAIGFSYIYIYISLLNTQHYKVRIKGKVEQSTERSSALPYTPV